jgi:hypothetical protein
VELTPPVTRVDLTDTCRLIPTRYPAVGVFDRVASADDLEAVMELETWTNDRISTELGILHRLPKREWIVGKPLATVIMAAFCHPRPGGGRFNSDLRGAWYAATSLDTAHAEVAYHRTAELAEVGVLETRMEMRLYLADFHTEFHDVRADTPENAAVHNPRDYTASQTLGETLLAGRSNGVIYRRVRRAGGECIACFRPKLIENLRPDIHFEYEWGGKRSPKIRRI